MPTTFFQDKKTSFFGQSKDKGLNNKKNNNTFHTVEFGVRQYYSPKYYSGVYFIHKRIFNLPCPRENRTGFTERLIFFHIAHPHKRMSIVRPD